MNENDEIEVVGMTLRISSPDFAPEDVLLSSVVLLALDESGAPLSVDPVTIKNAPLPNSTMLDHENVAADIGDTHMRAYFEMDFTANPLLECPTSFLVLGVGHDGETASFEFGASFIDSEHVIAFINAANEFAWEASGAGQPGVEVQVGCSAAEHFTLSSGWCSSGWSPPGAGCIGASGSGAGAAASIAVEGHSLSIANANPPPSGSTTCGPLVAGCPLPPPPPTHVSGTAMLIVTFSGCCACSVTFSGTANVSANVEVSGVNNYSGFAVGDGSICFAAPCDSDCAAAGALVFTAGEDDNDSDSDSGSISCTVGGCLPTFMVASSKVRVRTSATSTSYWASHFGWPRLFRSGCTARAEVTSFVGTFNTVVLSADCPDCDPELNDDCPPY